MVREVVDETTESRLSVAAFGTIVGAGSLALLGGVAVGLNTYDKDAAIEAVKGEKPTAAAEALAMRAATRALAYGTALALGGAVASVVAARYVLHLESIDDVRSGAQASLEPVHGWLHVKGRQFESFGDSLQDLGRRAGAWLGLERRAADGTAASITAADDSVEWEALFGTRAAPEARGTAADQ